MLEVGGWIATTCILTYLLTYIQIFSVCFPPFFGLVWMSKNKNYGTFFTLLLDEKQQKIADKKSMGLLFFLSFSFLPFFFFFFCSVFCLWCVVWCVWRMVEWFEQKKTWGDESCVRVFKNKKKSLVMWILKSCVGDVVTLVFGASTPNYTISSFFFFFFSSIKRTTKVCRTTKK